MWTPEVHSVWEECHPDILACLHRLLQQDLTIGRKTIQSCRLVNRHWHRVLTQSVTELTPKLTIFTFWDLCSIRKFTNLKKLTLRDHSVISDAWLQELPRVTPQLEALAVRFITHASRRGPFSRKGIQCLADLEHLNHLEIAGSEFCAMECLRTLATKSSLTYLDLSENGLSYRCIQPLTTLVQLQSLVLGGNEKLGDNTMRLMQSFPHLRRLSVRHCLHVSDKGVLNLAMTTGLTSLDLRTCDGVEGLVFQACAHLPLSRLDLMGCSNLKDESLTYIARLRFLKYLDLRMCPKITDGGLEQLKNLSSIVDLRIGAGTEEITDQGMAFLTHLPCLEHLTLFYLKEVTHAGIERVYSVETLRRLTIVQCQKIALDYIKQFLKGPPGLTIEHYPCTMAAPAPVL